MIAAEYMTMYTDKRRQIQTAEATALNEVVIVAEGLEIPLVALYLLTIVGILGVGAFLVSRQVLLLFQFCASSNFCQRRELLRYLTYDFNSHRVHTHAQHACIPVT